MLKKIVIATMSASTVLAFFALGMSGCSNNSSPMAESDQGLVNSAQMNPVPTPTRPPMPSMAGQHVSMSGFNMNSLGSQIMVGPSQRIQASATYIYNCPNCKPDTNNQILVGLAGRSAQACIYNGGSHGDGVAEFLLKAPAKQGTYAVRFRYAQATDCEEAMRNWWNVDNSPAQDTTIGQIIVR